jgi:hypothetical protein
MEDLNIHSLDNSNNYKYELIHPSGHIFKVYADILNRYVSEFNRIKKIYFDNVGLYYYLFDKGVTTIAHIFKILLINTKNVDLVKYYCIKSINNYIEFIEQNNRQADDKIKYTHASLFSYGNTIYKLNKFYRKTAFNILDETAAYIIHKHEEKEISTFKNIDFMIDIYNKQIAYAMHTESKHTESVHTESVHTESVHTESKHTQDMLDYSMKTLIELYHDNNILSEEVNFELEQLMETKLSFAVDVITLTNITSINILLTQLREKNYISLNKDILLKKILHSEGNYKNEEEYIKWLLS